MPGLGGAWRDPHNAFGRACLSELQLGRGNLRATQKLVPKEREPAVAVLARFLRECVSELAFLNSRTDKVLDHVNIEAGKQFQCEAPFNSIESANSVVQSFVLTTSLHEKSQY